MTSKLIKFAAIAALVGAAAGCSSNDEMRAEIDKAVTTAESAQSTATAAQSAAQQAQQTADRAIKGVQEAKSCCQANSQRIERAFQQSQSK